jgi:diguanylate cyclase (GGDEF)-like protein
MNRRAFDDRLEADYSRLQRFPSSFSLAFVDIDHFKKVHDTYGHLAAKIGFKPLTMLSIKLSRKDAIK